MRILATTLLIFFSLTSYGQVIPSRNGNFNYVRSFQDRGDHIHWKGSLIDVSTGDTILVIHNDTHDHPAPIAHWSGSKLVFHEGDTIKVYDPVLRKILYAKAGMIWHHAEHFFDSKNNILFFIRCYTSDRLKFDLFMLNVTELNEKLLGSLITSGSSISGIPSIVNIDSTKRELLVEIETKDYRSDRITVSY